MQSTTVCRVNIVFISRYFIGTGVECETRIYSKYHYSGVSYERTHSKDTNQFDPTAEFKSTKISLDADVADFHFELLQNPKLTFLL